MKGIFDPTTVENNMPILLGYLAERLEFEPALIELKELYLHLRNSVLSYNNDMKRKKFDRLSLPDVAYEAMIRFLHYEYGVIQDEIDFLYQYKNNRSGLITKLKFEQAKRFHLEEER